MSKPLIGVMPLWDEGKKSIWMLPGYLEGIREAGGTPVMFPLTEDREELEQLCSLCNGFLITGGQDQNRGIGIVLSELAENFQTVRAGKIQIQQDQVIIFCHTQAKPFVSIETDICFITIYAKSLRNRAAELLFVFYN